MKHFRRVLGYLQGQYLSVILSILCAMGVAGLLSLSLAAMLPLMKVLINEEGLEGWVHRTLVKQRMGIKLEAIEEAIGEGADAKIPLRVIKVDLKSPAWANGLRGTDEIVALKTMEGEIHGRRAMLEWLARNRAAKTVTMVVKRMGQESQDATMDLSPEPLSYRLMYGPMYWFLDRLPKDQGLPFKRSAIVSIILLMLGATFVRCGLRFAQEYLVKRVAFRCINRLRRDMYSNAIRLPLQYFSERGVSDVISRFVQDTNQINTGIMTVLDKLVREPFTVLFLAVGALTLNAKMTMIVLAAAPAAALVIAKLGKKMKKATKRTLQSWSDMLSRLQQSLLGVRVVKGYHREEHEQSRFENVNERLFKQQCRMVKIDAANGPILEALGMTAASIGMIFAAYVLTSEKSYMEVSEFSTLVVLLATMAESGRKLGDVWPRLQTANAAAERVFTLMDTPAEQDSSGAVELNPLKQELEFRGIFFRYPRSTQQTLENINFKIRAGETNAVVGPNGAGKTTLTSLIPRFFTPDQGQILIDGQDISQASLSSLRRQIGIVTQQIVVFNDTIADNIAYGQLQASLEDIQNAARRAYAHEFIEQTPQGYNTMIGENGATLSGGQLQRISIARAILSDPAILIFDEALSQIDSDSEAKIQKAIFEFSEGRTCFIIAHRLSTIVNADRIVVMDQGRIKDIGRHEDLIGRCGLYRQLYEMQFARDVDSPLSEQEPGKAV